MKKLFKGMLLLLPMMLLVGCGEKEAKVEEVDEKFKIAAEDVIESLGAEDFAKVYEMGNGDIKAVMTEEALKETFEPINDEIGSYKEVIKTIVNEKEGITTVIATAQYDNGTKQYSISFDQELKLAGLYIN